MNTLLSRSRLACALLSALTLTVGLLAEGPFTNRDNPDPNDSGEGRYPMPYHKPKVEEVVAVLQRVHAHLVTAMTTGIVDAKTKQPIALTAKPTEDAMASRGEESGFPQIAYATGVTHSAMLYAAQVTGDARYKDFVEERLKFLGASIPFFRAQAERFGVETNSYRALFATESLDDSGSMCAALIKARFAGASPELRPVIDHWANYIRTKQFRLADGMLARQRPQPESVWADDAYMCVPALAQMGRLTGDKAWTDEAVKQVLLFAEHLFNEEKGLYTHGRNINQPLNPEFYWGRANGWVILAQCELLDVLPVDHPDREKILTLYRRHVKALAELQSGAGLWHQLLDKPDSFLESSCTAMFVYGIAHGINRGWISPVSYGSVAQAGWLALERQVNEKGQLENSCVGTTFASDAVYYYNRPVSAHHGHAYGPVLLAGAEMIRLLQNEGKLFEIKRQFRTYHYVPKSGAVNEGT